MLMTGLTDFLGVALILAKLPRRLMLQALGYPLALDLLVSAATLLVHWGTFSGVMAATVARLLTSPGTSAARRLFGHNLGDDGIAFTQQKSGARLVVRWSAQLYAAVDRVKGLGGNVRALTLLHNRRGKAPDYRSVLLQWHTARKTAGVEGATPHDVRAMALTAMKKQRGKEVARAVAGRSSAAQIERYLREREIPVVDGPAMERVLGAK